jgi:hypothetical protein
MATNDGAAMMKRQNDLFPELPGGKKYVSDHAELLSEWHPSKNGNLHPGDLSHGSNRSVWWRCNEGHEWQSTVFNRAKHRKGCPYCAGRKVSSTNNLEYCFPEITKFWSPENTSKPEQVIARSGKQYLWKCENGHEWRASPNSLVRKKFPCPECQHEGRGDGLRRATDTFNLVTEFPRVAKQWHSKNRKAPSFYMPRSNDKVWWQCERGHEWEASIDSRTRGNGCPYCAGKKPSSEYNFATLHPELLSQWDHSKNPKSPSLYLPQSNKPVWWKCERGHEWQAPVYRRTGGAGCPSCTNQTSKNELRIYTELAAVFANVLHRQKLDGVEVDVYLPDFRLAIEYDGKFWHHELAQKDQLKHDHLASLGVKLLRVREAPLPKLQAHDIIIPMGSFLNKGTMDQLVSLFDPGSAYLKEVQFVAEKIYLTYLEFFPSPFPENSLAKVNPELAKEWHPHKNSPLTPENFTQSAKPKVWWQCSHGHEWKAAIYSRNIGGHSCPYCSGFRATKETNMAITHPQLALLFHPTKNGDLSPETVKAGTGIRLWWQCHCGHEWQQTGDKLSKVKTEPCSRCRSLNVKRPDIAAMWHPTMNGSLTPTEVPFGSCVNRWWQCQRNSDHTWRASPNNMTKPDRKTFCPSCK